MSVNPFNLPRPHPDDVCAICLCPMELNQVLAIPLKHGKGGQEQCPHHYHRSCLEQNRINVKATRIINGLVENIPGVSVCPQCRMHFNQILPVVAVAPEVSLPQRRRNAESQRRAGLSQDSALALTSRPRVERPSAAAVPRTRDEIYDSDGSSTPSSPFSTATTLSSPSPSAPPSQSEGPRNVGEYIGPISTLCDVCGEHHRDRKSKSRCRERRAGPYFCPFCNRKFAYKELMKKHAKNIHSVNIKYKDYPAGFTRRFSL